MHHSNRIFYLIFLVAIIGFLVPQASAQDRITITYWRPAYDVERDVTIRMVAAFEARYPHIRIDMAPTSSYEEKIKTALAGGVAPDIMAIDGPLIAFYAHQGALIPLDRYYTPENVADFIPATIEEITWNGHVWTGPLNNSSIAVYYNVDQFERAGIIPPKEISEAWTWEEFASHVQTVVQVNQRGAETLHGSLIHLGIDEFAAYIQMPWIWQTGGRIMAPDGMRAAGYLDSPASVRGLTVFQSLFLQHGIASVEEITEGFQTGKYATQISGPWSLRFYNEMYPDLNYDVMPLPRGLQQVTPCGSWHMAITSQSKHPDEAWLFVDWMTGVEGARRWARETQNLPARHSTYDALPELAEYPFKIFADQVRYTARPRPVTPVYPVVTDAVAQAFQSAAYGEPPAEVLKKAAIRIDEAVAYEQIVTEGQPVSGALLTTLAILTLLVIAGGVLALRRRLRHRPWGRLKQESIWGYALIAPAVCGLAVFVIIPMFAALYLSFHHPFLFRPGMPMTFVGLENYRQLFLDPLFWQSLMNSAYFTMVVVPVQTAVALGLALLIREKIKGLAFFRSAFFIPVITSMVVAAIIWRVMYNTDAGLINGLLVHTGLSKQLFLSSTTQAMPSIMVMGIWKSCGFFMLIFLAGLQAIPEELYEAATVDGAGRWHRFRHVTLPMLNQPMLFVLVITTMDAMKLFAPIFIMTDGGPLNSTTVIVHYIYKNMFLFLKAGYASAMAFVLFCIILVLTLIQMKLLRRDTAV